MLALAFGFNEDFLLKSETPEDDEGEDGIGVGLEEFREEIKASVICGEECVPLVDAVSI